MKILACQCNGHHEYFGVYVELWREALDGTRDHNAYFGEDGHFGCTLQSQVKLKTRGLGILL